MILHQPILRYIFILIISLAGVAGARDCSGQTTTVADTVATDSVKPKVPYVEKSGRHLSLGVDIYHPVMNQFVSGRSGIDFSLDYYTRHDIYVVAEGGFGTSKVNYSNLQYNTSNSFYRAGVNRSLVLRQDSTDWNNMFIGFRGAAAAIHRGPASYVVTDSLWGNETGSQPGKDFVAAWLELCLGVRVQLFGSVSAGWTISGKFMMNGKSFSDLAPLYIAGYGRGDKNSSFDFDFYLSYGLSWKRKSQRLAAVTASNNGVAPNKGK